MKGLPLFSAVSTTLVRVAALPVEQADVTRVDLDPDIPHYGDRLTWYVRSLLRDRVFREAVQTSSASMSIMIEKLESGAPVDLPSLERSAFALTRYLLRMTGRPTPFGLMAGVTLGRLGEELKVRVGDQHRKHVDVDGGWIAALVAELHGQAEVRRSLRVMANDLTVERGNRLVLPFVRARGDAPRQREVSVRCTPAVRAALRRARRPLPWQELKESLLRDFPQAGEEAVEGLLAKLLAEEFLLSDLTPPPTETDPLGHLRDRLAGHPAQAALARAGELLSRYAERPLGDGGATWQAAVSELRRWHAASPARIDLRFDADITLPRQVAEEIEHVASVLWKVSTPTGELAHLAEYRDAILDRYGDHNPVPILELLDPHRGIDAPAGYRNPPSARSLPRQAAVDPDWEDAVAAMLQRAWSRGETEIVLDDRLIARLSAKTDGPPPASLELCVQISAESASELEHGRFQLYLSPMATDVAGAMFGRFAHLLGAEREVAFLLEQAAGGRTPVQVIFPPNEPRLENVCRVPQLLDHVVPAASFTADPGTIELRDIAIGATPDRLYAVSLRDGREIAPIVPHMLNLQKLAPNAARLLSEITATGVHNFQLWYWGRFDAFPYLPRIRLGRTIISPARWRPDPALADPKSSWSQWCRELDRWRAEWRVPDRVQVMFTDHRIELDLTTSLHRRLLRSELCRKPGAVCYEPPPGGRAGTGWSDGYSVEIVVPLTRRGAVRPEPVGTAPRTVASTGTLRHPPGGEWLFAKIYAAEHLHDALITDELPRLVHDVPEWIDRWFFIRYRDPDPHIRLRFHGDPKRINSELIVALREWEERTRRRGMLRTLVLDTYEPELDRYGGPDAMADAERFFRADSESVIGQLQARDEGSADLPPEVLAAMNHLDILRSLGDWDWARWVVDNYPRRPLTFLADARELLPMLDPCGDWDLMRRRVAGAERLLACWRFRAPAAARYARRLLLADVPAPDAPATRALLGVLHMHANRLIGMNPDCEARSYAILRAVAHSHLVRRG